MILQARAAATRSLAALCGPALCQQPGPSLPAPPVAWRRGGPGREHDAVAHWREHDVVVEGRHARAGHLAGRCAKVVRGRAAGRHSAGGHAHPGPPPSVLHQCVVQLNGVCGKGHHARRRHTKAQAPQAVLGLLPHEAPLRTERRSVRPAPRVDVAQRWPPTPAARPSHPAVCPRR